MTVKKKYLFVLSVSVLIVIYIILRLTVLDSDPIYSFLTFLENSYLSLFEKVANQIIHFIGYNVIIDHNQIFENGVQLPGYIPAIKLKRWLTVFVIIVWFTKTSIKNRVLFSLLLVTVHFLLISICIALGACFASDGLQVDSLLSIPYTISLLILITILFYWFKTYKKQILNSLAKFKINAVILNNNVILYVSICFFIIVTNFLFVFFEYELWINFLFTSAQKILTLFGYKAIVEPFYLIGSNGSIFMGKACLGFQTMFLFAIMIFLTGRNNIYQWVYIISGLLLLNFINIIRFVLLFIYIQKHDANLLAVEVHDMYNYIVYAVVFILWVIWFNFFADKVVKRADMLNPK